MKNHKQIGREMNLFDFHPSLKGEVIWYPNGIVLLELIKKYLRENSKDYQEISTPLLVDNRVFNSSGHIAKYKNNMFILGNESLKPMNCPETCLVFNLKKYKLPCRFSEFGLVHRKERSGVITGLFRLREFTQDDGHVFLKEEQVKEEIESLLKNIERIYSDFGFEPKFCISTVGMKKQENILRNILPMASIKENEGAFYGPKIDTHVKDSLGRNWQLGTIQLDYVTPKRMGINAVMIHRAILGSLERFIAILLENSQGKLPYWLSPIQIAYIPVSEKYTSYIKKFLAKTERFVILDSNKTVALRVREAKILKIPSIKVIGERELKNV